MKEVFLSFKNNLKGKISNPFFGTLIFVWSIHNYKFIYSVFNFPKSMTLTDRLVELRKFKSYGFSWENMGICLLWTLFALLLSFIFTNMSRLLVEFSDKQVVPWIKKIVDKNSVVDRDRFDLIVKDAEKNLKNFEDEQEKRLKSTTELETLRVKVQNQIGDNKRFRDSFEIEKAKLNADLLGSNNTITSLEKQIEELKRNASDINVPIIFRGIFGNRSVLEAFRKACVAIENNGGMQRGEYDELVKLGLVTVIESSLVNFEMLTIEHSIRLDSPKKNIDYFKGDKVELTDFGIKLRDYLNSTNSIPPIAG